MYSCIKCGYCGDKLNHTKPNNFMGCPYPAVLTINTKTDPIVDAVCADLQSRSSVGIKKYGTTLYENMGDLRYWLQHAYEETLDHANYLKRAIMEIDKQVDDNK